MAHHYVLEKRQWVPSPLETVFPFFADAANLQELTPNWLRFSILTPQPVAMHAGALIDYKLHWHGLPMRWKTEITLWEPPHRFQDLQLRGPYALWRHTHRFLARDGGTELQDRVEYALPFGPLGRIAHGISVRRDVERIFAYRWKKVEEIFGTAGPGSTQR
jgi:ligand-binding SRPBCC domain-containing protein